MDELGRKLSALSHRLRCLGRLAVAYSGGVDSTFLLKVAADTLGRENVLALTANSPVTAASELERAKELARAIGVQHLIVESREFEDLRFVANPPDRCYFCKRVRFEQLGAVAREHGFQHIADGTNVDDTNDYRPGLRAAEELGVLGPLRDAGFTKADIRAASRGLGLPTADLPSFACLASRVPYGIALDAATLRRIEAGEQLLADLGLRQYRLRHHGDVARLEALPEDFPEVLAARESLVSALRGLGYRYVALDLAGYRSGSLNEALA